MEYSEAFDGAKATLKIWPDGKMPGEKANGPEHAGDPANDVLRISGVSEPALYLYPAQNATKPAPCMIVCPGGGYSILAWNLEGTEIAEFLAANGMTAVILKYRCPNNRAGAFQDAQRAIRQVRAHAAEWGINPNCVGIMGFSAGGHLTVRATCKFNEQSYAPIDDIDKISARPDFAVPVYPAYLEKDGQVSPELLPLENLPPMLFIHNADDTHWVPSSRVFTRAACEAGFDCTFRHYTDGGHGYGLRSKKAVKDWGRAMVFWFKEKRYLP